MSVRKAVRSEISSAERPRDPRAPVEFEVVSDNGARDLALNEARQASIQALSSLVQSYSFTLEPYAKAILRVPAAPLCSSIFSYYLVVEDELFGFESCVLAVPPLSNEGTRKMTKIIVQNFIDATRQMTLRWI